MIVDRLTMAFIQRDQPNCGWRVVFDNGGSWYRCLSCVIRTLDGPQLKGLVLERCEPMLMSYGQSCALCGVQLQQYMGDLPCR